VPTGPLCWARPTPSRKKSVRLLAIAVAAQRSRTKSFAGGEVVAPNAWSRFDLRTEAAQRQSSIRSSCSITVEGTARASGPQHARGQRAPFAITRSTSNMAEGPGLCPVWRRGHRLQAGRRQLPIRPVLRSRFQSCQHRGRERSENRRQGIAEWRPTQTQSLAPTRFRTREAITTDQPLPILG
jgi:hypothetical protein